MRAPTARAAIFFDSISEMNAPPIPNSTAKIRKTATALLVETKQLEDDLKYDQNGNIRREKQAYS